MPSTVHVLCRLTGLIIYSNYLISLLPSAFIRWWNRLFRCSLLKPLWFERKPLLLQIIRWWICSDLPSMLGVPTAISLRPRDEETSDNNLANEWLVLVKTLWLVLQTTVQVKGFWVWVWVWVLIHGSVFLIQMNEARWATSRKIYVVSRNFYNILLCRRLISRIIKVIRIFCGVRHVLAT